MWNWESVKKWLDRTKAFFYFLASIAALTAFVSLYLSVDHFNRQQEIAHQEKSERFVNIIGSLQLEIEGNLHLCANILKKRDKYLKADIVPMNSFEYTILRQILSTGEITEHRIRAAMPGEIKDENVTERKFRITLFNAYHRMVTLNQLIEHTINLMHLQVIVKPEPEVVTRTAYRLKTNMSMMIADTEFVRDHLLACLPTVIQLKEHYIKELDVTEPDN